MLWQICVVFIALYGVFLRWKMRKLRKIHAELPVNLNSVPILGHAMNFHGNGQDRMKGFQKLGRDTIDNCGGVSSWWLANKLIVTVADPVVAEAVLKNCLEKDDMMKVSHLLIGYGSIFAPVSIWRPRRKFIAPIFNQKTLNALVKVFSKQAAILTEQLKVVLDIGNLPLYDKVAKYSMDSVCQSVLGVELNSQSRGLHPIPKAFNRFCDLTADRILKPWLYPTTIFQWHWNYPQALSSSDVLKEFVSKIITTKRIKYEQNKNRKELDGSEETAPKTRSLVELLIEAGNTGSKGFTDLELQEETLVMLVAGTDTSSIAVSFAALLMAKYPDTQEKVYQEIKDVVGTDRPVEADDLPKLKYLDAVVKESLRMYPPVPVIVRKTDKEFTLPSGVTLVPGVCVLIHIWAMHRNKKYWGADADVFRPERFLEGRAEHPCAFIPFSNGPRNCLGAQYAMMSIKTVTAHLVRQYRLLPSTADCVSNEKDIPVSFEIMMKDVNNFKLRLQKRI